MYVQGMLQTVRTHVCHNALFLALGPVLDTLLYNAPCLCLDKEADVDADQL